MDLTTEEEQPSRFSWKAFWQALWASALVGLVLTGLGGLAGLVLGSAIPGVDSIMSGVGAGALSGVLWGANLAKGMLSVNRLSIRSVQITQRPRVELAEEFYAEFVRILDHRNTSKLVVVIDNVDRCSPDVAMKVLATVKNFLELPDPSVFFLIPCDREALERHLSATFRSRGLEEQEAAADAREYVGKFFGATLSMTPVRQAELHLVAAANLRRMQLGHNLDPQELDDIAAIASSANRTSPREVQVFMNKVATSWLVAEQGGSQGADILGLKDVAKLSALQDKAPALWSLVEDDPSALAEAESRLVLDREQWPEDPVSTALRDSEAVRITRALQWHPVGEQQVRVFLGLRQPIQAANVPRYFDVIAAIQDGNMELVADVAGGVEVETAGLILDLVGEQVVSFRHGTAERLVNPASVGLTLLGTVNVPSRNQAEYLGSLSDALMKAAVRRVGPAVAATAARHTQAISRSEGILSEVIAWLGESNDPIQVRVVDALDEIRESLSDEHFEAAAQNVSAALVADIGFERHLRAASVDIRRRILDTSSIQRLADACGFPEDGNAEPENAEAFDALFAHASLVLQNILDGLGARAASYLTLRKQADHQLDEVAVSTINKVLDLREASGAGDANLFGEYLNAIVDERNANTYQVLTSMEPPLEPRLSGDGKEALARMVADLVVGVSGLDTSSAIGMAHRASQAFSEAGSQFVADRVSDHLAEQDDDAALTFLLALASGQGPYDALNRSAAHRSSRSPSALRWLRERIHDLPGTTRSRILGGTIDALIQHLQVPETFQEAARELREQTQAWSSSEARRVIDVSVPYLSSGDAAQADHAAGLILVAAALFKSLEPIREARAAALGAMISGPLGLDAPPELFALQREGMAGIPVALKTELRRFLRERLGDVNAEVGHLFEAIEALVKADRAQSNELFRPVIEYALTCPDLDKATRAGELLAHLSPSRAEVSANTQGLRELSEKIQLSQRWARYGRTDAEERS